MTIHGFNADLTDNKYGVYQGSILDCLLFLVGIKDLHCAIKYCKVHHFADDINPTQNSQNSRQLLNKS